MKNFLPLENDINHKQNMEVFKPQCVFSNGFLNHQVDKWNITLVTLVGLLSSVCSLVSFEALS